MVREMISLSQPLCNLEKKAATCIHPTNTKPIYKHHDRWWYCGNLLGNTREIQSGVAGWRSGMKEDKNRRMARILIYFIVVWFEYHGVLVWVSCLVRKSKPFETPWKIHSADLPEASQTFHFTWQSSPERQTRCLISGGKGLGGVISEWLGPAARQGLL